MPKMRAWLAASQAIMPSSPRKPAYELPTKSDERPLFIKARYGIVRFAHMKIPPHQMNTDII